MRIPNAGQTERQELTIGNGEDRGRNVKLFIPNLTLIPPMKRGSMTGMKWTLPLMLTLVCLGNASAQTKIGNVTLTKPSTPAPTRMAPVHQAGAGTTASSNVPAGWSEVKGRINAATPVTLPAGSKVTVIMEDQTTSGQFVRIQFKTSRLSTPYQIIFSPGRLNSNHQYTVRASITDASGKTIYQSGAVRVPNASRSVIDLTVR